MAVLSGGGTWPEINEWFIICVRRGLMADRFVLMSAVGKGSRGEVEGFIFLIRPSTSICVTVVKVFKKGGCEPAGGKDGAGEPES
jgi:hypothetical protein